jgi:hypothetical protein
LVFSFSCLDYIFHCQPCHISLWQSSIDNFWHPHDPDSHILSSLKNNAQILIAFRDVRWALYSADYASGWNSYSARSNSGPRVPDHVLSKTISYLSSPFHFPRVVQRGASQFTMSLLLLLQHSTVNTLDHISIVRVESK